MTIELPAQQCCLWCEEALMAGRPTTVAVVGVNNGSVGAVTQSGANIRRVLITPFNPRPGPVNQVVIEKMLLKAVTKSGPKKDKIFTLRHIDVNKVSSSNDLKKLIKNQLCDDVIHWEEFDVGHVGNKQNEKVIAIRNKEDLTEVWEATRKHGDKMLLWCDGLKADCSQKKRKRATATLDGDDSDDDQPTKKKSIHEEREDKLKEALDGLKTKHGSNYTFMQYRIWSEMYANGMHTDLDSPPTNSMFKRAGSGTPISKKKNDSPEMAQALTHAATQVSSAITAALTPKSSASSSSTGVSPARAIESRSKCYRQLGELQNLKLQGLLNEEDYDCERAAIMGLLKKLV